MKRRRRVKGKLILGVTGSFGSGKTTVAKMLAAFGGYHIDADSIAHSLLRPGNKIYRRIIRVFGSAILKNDRSIDRHKLAALIFSRKNLLKKLESIVHPEVIRIIKIRIRRCRKQVVILDAPLLIEAGLKNWADKLIVVKLAQAQQLKRIGKKRRLDRREILSRIRAQLPLQNKIRLADFVIDNNGTLRETKRQVSQIRRMWWKN